MTTFRIATFILDEGALKNLQPRAVLYAAKHDEGVYRLHSLT